MKNTTKFAIGGFITSLLAGRAAKRLKRLEETMIREQQANAYPYARCSPEEQATAIYHKQRMATMTNEEQQAYMDELSRQGYFSK